MNHNFMPKFQPERTKSQQLNAAFEFYKKNNREVDSPVLEGLNDSEKQACYILACRATSKKDNDLENQISQLGGFEEVVSKMISLAEAEAKSFGYVQEDAYKFMSIENTIKYLQEQKEEETKNAEGRS